MDKLRKIARALDTLKNWEFVSRLPLKEIFDIDEKRLRREVQAYLKTASETLTDYYVENIKNASLEEAIKTTPGLPLLEDLVKKGTVKARKPYAHIIKSIIYDDYNA